MAPEDSGPPSLLSFGGRALRSSEGAKEVCILRGGYYLLLPMTTKPRRAAASPVSVKLDADERTRLSAVAAVRKRSSHYLMREELRQDFADEAEKARADFEKTGLHVTHAEMDAWAKSLGTRRPKRFPKWHK